MRRFVCGIFLLMSALYADNASPLPFLKGVHSLTVQSVVSPYILDASWKTVLESLLASRGTVIRIEGKEAESKAFYEAMSTSACLRLYLENRIVETKASNHKAFKVEVHLVLECIDQSQEAWKKHKEYSALPRWVVEDKFDFSPDKTLLLDRGQKAVKGLISQFLEAQKQVNPEEKSPLTFFIL